MSLSTLVKGYSDFKTKTCFFSVPVGSLQIKFHIDAKGSTGIKIYTNKLGQMTKIAAMPIYGREVKKLCQNICADGLETWYVAFGTRVLFRMFKL